MRPHKLTEIQIHTINQARCKEFPHAVAFKVFCFGHSFEAEAVSQHQGGLDALEAGFKQHKDQLVVFPPEGDDRVSDGGMSMVGRRRQGLFKKDPQSTTYRSLPLPIAY